jgi:ABC-type lipoprotein export system ATPase subunit
MQLQLKNILPSYFEETRKNGSEIWGKDLVFSKGELIKIVAPSGSGKTSLVHFFYGMRQEYTGNIFYDDKDIKNFTVEDFADYRKKNISVVFQDMRLFTHQTVFENIEIKRQLNPYHPAEKIKEMCEKLGIGTKLQSLCRTCSYGEQQRMAIIRAMMQPFDLLLLDEPFSHLDDNNSVKAMELMLEETKLRGASVVFADLERIEFFPYTRILHL